MDEFMLCGKDEAKLEKKLEKFMMLTQEKNLNKQAGAELCQAQSSFS